MEDVRLPAALRDRLGRRRLELHEPEAMRHDNEVEVELAPNVKVRVVRSTISQVVSKTEPAEA